MEAVDPATLMVVVDPAALKVETGEVLVVEAVGGPPPQMERKGNPEAKVAETPTQDCLALG